MRMTFPSCGRPRDTHLALEDAVEPDGSSGQPCAAAHGGVRSDGHVAPGNRQIAGDWRVHVYLGRHDPHVFYRLRVSTGQVARLTT